MIDAWVAIREIALADVQALPGSRDRLDRLDAWIDRARTHFVHGTDDDCRPFLSSVDVASLVLRVRDAFERCRREPLPFDALYRWSEGQGPETAELVVSLLLELHDGDDELIDELLTVDERSPLDPAATVAHLRIMLASRFEWLARLDLDDESADAWWWVISDNTEEPRRALRDRLEPACRDVAIDVALRLWRLRGALDGYDDATPIQLVLSEQSRAPAGSRAAQCQRLCLRRAPRQRLLCALPAPAAAVVPTRHARNEQLQAQVHRLAEGDPVPGRAEPS